MAGEAGRRGRRGDGITGLALGFAFALVLHALFLPGFGLFLQSEPNPADQKAKRQGAQLVRLAAEAWEQNRRVTLEVKDAQTPEAEVERKRREKVEDDVDAPGRVVSLPPPDKEERPEFADYASESNQRTDRETRSRDQEAIAPSVTNRRVDGTALGEVARAPQAPPAAPSSSSQSSGPDGPGRARTGDSGTDATDGRGERMFALEVPKQAAREPLQLKMDVEGMFKNRELVPEVPGTGDVARVAIGNRPMDAARKSGSGGLGDESGQGLRGGGNGTTGLPSLEQLTPTPQELARLAGAPANDHLPEVEVDAETRLNAWRWKHATFFNRIADAIRREWQGGEVLSSNDPGGNVYGFEDRMTVVQVTLDRSGNVLDVNVAEPSGAYVLDDEAVRAFKEAGPFANPPVALFKGEERFTFLFGFNVAYNRTNFDLNWRPN